MSTNAGALLERFRQVYGHTSFGQEKYIQNEYEYKRDRGQEMRESLGKDALQRLIDDRNWPEICKRASKDAFTFQQGALARWNEYGWVTKLEEEEQEQFCLALMDFLHGGSTFRDRFERFVAETGDIFARFQKRTGWLTRKLSWPFVSYFHFMMWPEQEYVLVKPQYLQAAAKLAGFDLGYHSAIEFDTYVRVQQFYRELWPTVQQLGGRDWIDVQSLIFLASTPYLPNGKNGRERFLERTLLESRDLDELEALLSDKKQMVFYGPPGTGKTWVGQELAHYFTGSETGRVEIVQFHPSYSYEEFIEGIRPEAQKQGPPLFPVKPGVFRSFCEQARANPGSRYVMIIDEINRGNIAKIFGELMFLLEYRGKSVRLAYSGELFSIPENVYIIGTMNTADRSIALVDFALRRRFHFFRFDADSEILKRWIDRNSVSEPLASSILSFFDQVNNQIEDRDYKIGFSYFMRPGLKEEDLKRIWVYNIEPYLDEYFFDRRDEVTKLRNKLMPDLQDS
ncbi:MAG: AAA domain-containing protein [Chloroflexi bacterium]|nr:AAA domain-containing protein [Chloroflexota bacterium]